MASESFDAHLEGRRNNFDFLRFWLAAVIIAYHCFPLLRGTAARPDSWIWALTERVGATAVPFFFVISGFLITQSWIRNPQLGSFFRKRILRIYPAFILASVFGALVVGPLSTPDAQYWQHFKWPKFLIYLFLLPADVVGPDMKLVFANLPFPHSINGSFWTLRYEFECYFLVAALGMLGVLRRKSWIFWAFVVLFAFWAIQTMTNFSIFSDREIPMMGNMQRRARLLLFFAAGALFYLGREQIPHSRTLFWISLAAVVFSSAHHALFEIALPIFGSYGLLYIAFSPRLKLQNFGKYGDYSYGLYLYAFPVQQLLVYRFGVSLSPYVLFFAALILSLICAVLSWHAVEKRFLRLKPRVVAEDLAR